jgi:type IV pilus assembly protein PilP
MSKKLMTLMRVKLTQNIFVIVFSLLLSGCGGNDKDLEAYVAEVLKRPGGAVEPLPTIEPYEPFYYSSIDRRSPFDLPKKQIADAISGPDMNRPKEKLEQFALDSLRMVGTMGQQSERWVLISAPDGDVHRITIGNYLGKNFGKITSINKQSISIIETVPDNQGGWMQRKAELTLVQ